MLKKIKNAYQIYSKLKNCQYFMNRIEADKKVTTREVILQIKVVAGTDITLKSKFLKVSQEFSFWPLHLRHISLTIKSVCTLVSLFQSTDPLFAPVSFM